VFTSSPITVSGLCQTGLLIKIFSNNIFVGSEICTDGSFSLQVPLFSGLNDLVAQSFDALGQSGPDSNVIAVTYNDAQFAQNGTQVTLTSSYADRGADPGQELSWPLTLNGGVGPYAISVDWGDSSSPELLTASNAGAIAINHTYSAAGVYKVVIRATDSKGNTGFLEVVGIGNGQITAQSSTKVSPTVITKTELVWWPSAILLPIIIAAFWLGGKHELYSIRRELEKSRNEQG
jgi:hypothetical protein